MMKKIRNWLKNRGLDADESAPATFKNAGASRQVAPRKTVKPRPAPDFIQKPAPGAPKTQNAASGESGLSRNKFVREDTGTHETLKILDDSIIDSGEEPGIDPYNTGGFDRSKNWNNRFRD